MSYAATERRPYDDDDLNSEEEEEERLLSAEHGEASDDGPKRKRSTKTTTFSEADAAAAKEFEEKVRAKKSRPALTTADLKGPKGLVVVRRSFPGQVKYREQKKAIGTGAKSNTVAQKMNQQSQITSAASYTRSLMSAYKNFARALFPSLAPEDVLLKVEDMGSKKEVKDYLQIMRNDVRREYLEGIYGSDKTDRILHELENGVGISREDLEEQLEVDDRPVARKMGEAVYDEEVVGGTIERGVTVTNPYGKEKSVSVEEPVPKDVGTDVSESDEEEELEFVGKETPSKDTEKAGNDGTEIVETAKDTSESVEDGSPVEDSVERSSDELAEMADEAVETAPAEQDTIQDVAATENEETPEAANLESVETPTVADTQETLTLVASQFGEEDMPDEPEDEVMNENITTKEDAAEESQDYTQFSQGETHFTQTERFSQSNLDASESNFQIEEQSQDDNMQQSLQLGQETQAEASQEY
jgi:hypothetical protein